MQKYRGWDTYYEDYEDMTVNKERGENWEKVMDEASLMGDHYEKFFFVINMFICENWRE